MKRSAAYPDRRSHGEFKLNNQRVYNQMVKQPSKVNPIFTERPHLGIPEPKEVKDV